jgi:hypothetical protein
MTAAHPVEITKLAEEGKKLPKLKHWSRYGSQLLGAVYDHPRFGSGERIITSTVKQMGDGWAQTLNTLYLLIGPERT